MGSNTPSPPRADTAGEQPLHRSPAEQGSPGDPSRRSGRPLTLVEFIQTAGVAEGAQGSCLPAAPTLHPHRGIALAEAASYMAGSFRMEENPEE